MRKVIGILGVVFVLLVVIFIVWLLILNRDEAPDGEGSFREAHEIYAALAAIDPSESEDNLPDKFYRFEYDNGFSYIATGTDSHLPGGGGGTIGLLFADGSRHIFFGHVCGPGPTPLEFQGRSKESMLDNLRKEWHEHGP